MSEQSKNKVADKISFKRGPAFPFINLERAVEKVAIIADKGASRQKMPPETFYNLWGMGAKSSSSRQTMAALNYYDLVEYVGRGKERKVQLTELAIKVVLDKRPNSTEKLEAIQTAALQPQIFRELYDKYAPFLPDNVVIETHLIIDKLFSEDAAKTLIKNFRDTIEYSKLNLPNSTLTKNDSDLDETETNNNFVSDAESVKVGDTVQATIQGIDQFPNGAIVQGFSDDKQFVFVDQSNSGVPLKDITTIKCKETIDLATTPHKPSDLITTPLESTESSVPEKVNPNVSSPEGSRKAMFPLDEGDVTLIFPIGLGEDSLEDLSAYLEIFLKKEIKKAKTSIAQIS